MALRSRLTPSTPVYMTSGEATPSAKLPTEFAPTPQPNSPLTSHQRLTPVFAAAPSGQSAVVERAPRMNGMRYLYARGMRRQPIGRMGQSAVPRPYISAYQPNDMGPIRNGGFNDCLFQAGYPGFNLGLSFKVPSINTQGGPRTNFTSPITISQTRQVITARRSSGAPPRT